VRARILLALALLPLVAAPALAQSTLERVRRSGTLRIGTDATYPPLEYVEGGQCAGFDVDLGNALARELGVRAEFVNASFDGIFPALANGSFDAVMSSVTITPERSASMLFTDPYYESGQRIVVRRDTPGVATQGDLSGKHVGVQINTTAQYDLEKRPGIALTRYNTIDLALLDLQVGRIDAVVGDAPVLQHMIRQSFPELEAVGQRFTDEKFGIALARSSDDLRRALNAALWRVQQSGELDRLSEKWFGPASERSGESALEPASRAFDAGIVARTWQFLLAGVWLTARLALSSLAVGLPIGLGIALARLRSGRWLAVPAAVYVEFVRGTPLLVQILFIYFVLPTFGVHLPAFTSGAIALSLNCAAYTSEIFRAGVLSIDEGQMEAARALGMSDAQAMRRIILPQTFRRVVPPITNEGIALLKDSSLVSVIGLTELARTGQELASRYAAPLTIWPLVALTYLLITFPLTRAAEYLERRWRPVTRSQAP